MTNKETAEQLRKIAEWNRPENYAHTNMDLTVLANELDPPRPEPGTVVWWRYYDDVGWQGPTTLDSLEEIMFAGIEYKPARILGPDEVAIPKRATIDKILTLFPNVASAVYEVLNEAPTLAVITWDRRRRAESEHMEADQ